jgi:hypothetical protein
MDTMSQEFKIGYNPNALLLEFVDNEDTTVLFCSFACTQYHIEKNTNKISFYIWLENYYPEEEACLCIDDSEEKCRPDTSTSNVTITYSFFNNTTQCHISNFRMFIQKDKKFKQFIKHIENKQFSKLRNINKQIFTKEEQPQENILAPILVHYLDIVYYCSTSNNKKVESIVNDLIKDNYDYIQENKNLNYYIYYINFVNSIKNGIMQLQNKTLNGNDVFHSPCLDNALLVPQERESLSEHDLFASWVQPTASKGDFLLFQYIRLH